MKMKMKNRSHIYDINRTRSRYEYKYSKYKKYLYMILHRGIKQHIATFPAQFKKKLSNTEAELKE